MPEFTVTVGYYQLHEQSITLDAIDISEACNRAIAEAETCHDWRAANYCGESFIATLGEGRAESETERETLPAVAVPFRFQAARAAGRADLIPLLRDAAACIAAGIDAYVSHASYTKTLDDEAPEYVVDMEDVLADLHEAITAETRITEAATPSD